MVRAGRREEGKEGLVTFWVRSIVEWFSLGCDG